MIVIVGAGPAGMAAAVRARECGKRVTVLDDNPTAGGQIWRGGKGSPWFRRFSDSAAVLLTGRRVISGDARQHTLQIETGNGASEIEYETLILATGARELFLPFPGWTLPSVMGVGGLQALVKSGLPIAGKRIVVAGSGPLLLAVAHYLKKHRAIVPIVAEQAPWGDLLKFTAHLTPAKLLQAAALQTFAYAPDTWVIRAEGASRLERIHLNNGKTVSCDYLAVAYGFAPNDELATHLGASDSILRAGECTGIGGVELSVLEGEIAGYTAGGRPDLANKLLAKRKAAQRFANALNETFALRAELRALCEAETIVCRCEDVPFQTLGAARSWREAKLHFRCGMGPCQGRICGPAVNFLFNWQPESIRPPVFPARVSSLISNKETTTK
jgi:NADPH-dependent 2,4-dienoyl-CoA reductase/sulfur reductase-like enzyme